MGVRALMTRIIAALLCCCPFLAAEAEEPCAPWVARVVSAQGWIEVKRAGTNRWKKVGLDVVLCAGDTLHVREWGRAAVVMRNDAILRLDQNTSVVFSEIEQQAPSLLDLVKGAVHFISRVPRSLKVKTPFVNAATEGTEFVVRVNTDATEIWVSEGTIAAANSSGRILLTSGQAGVAMSGRAPERQLAANPRDAVRWALYYPPILGPKSQLVQTSSAASAIEQSIRDFWTGDLASAFSRLDAVPSAARDSAYYTYRASLLLYVGNVEPAEKDIDDALSLKSDNGSAVALQAIIAVVMNQNDQAVRLARRAVDIDPRAVGPRIALSYAYQANFDLDNALASAQEATHLDPNGALAWARLSELQLSLGALDRSLQAARTAIQLNPRVARTQTVLGFAYLAQSDTDAAISGFRQAIDLDQAAPLPRLGLGLAEIRKGELEAGRRNIEISVSLDPNNSICRSYLGKAYYEEKRDRLAADQFEMAKTLDPKDPTPWFYGAILRQSENQPVTALHDLQESIFLNDNRLVYRSRLLLDSDLAARSANLGRIFSDLGFEQLAVVQGWKSVDADPANYSAHRFLSDAYAGLPRHEAARVSELLQSQLLQPINLRPVQPQLAETNLAILEGAGTTDPGFNEFNPLFQQNGVTFQASGVVGGNETRGDELTLSGLADKYALSAGQFHYQTNGFRQNNDQQVDIYNLFAQGRTSVDTGLQAEVRRKEIDKGDLALRFTGAFSPDLRQREHADTVRLGLHQSLGPGSDLLASLIYQNADLNTDVIPGVFGLASKIDHYVTELGYLYRAERFDAVAGIGHRRLDDTTVSTFAGFPAEDQLNTRFSNLYLYTQTELPHSVNVTVGASADFLNSAVEAEDVKQFNPKFGLTWKPMRQTTLRAAALRTLQRPYVSQENIDPTLEPTQVAGFNQFFPALTSEKSWRYGVAADQSFSRGVYAGAELSMRDSDVPIVDATGPTPVTVRRDWKERFGRAYLYWTPKERLALSSEYLYERFRRDVGGGLSGVEQFSKLRTHRVLLGASYFDPSGISGGVKATYVDQAGDFTVPSSTGLSLEPGSDRFWVVDAAVGYRLPKRYGLIRFEVKNLFNKDFHFQDTDPGRPLIPPKRLIVLRFTLTL
jgi:tetratricopeptide (TPR) repeat protein